ncbi:fumarylacetoacetase [Thermogymnomonas acidicola]|uniref:Fumarylacetoacetase n=1 Tax=Thermogymnomonas acidicola TaxID=399579 RepID=A0AA37F9P3_9ARCH|nr:fumarylacetoacetate hydrolase family protein [Thermogymnomonas acidicola]GGM74668.1 fumarylacetoacetase [Thermogymnomonas acidicola]
MRVGRVRSDDGVHAVVFRENSAVPISSVMDVEEGELQGYLVQFVMRNRERIEKAVQEEGQGIDYQSILSPIPRIPSIRDFYTFEEHVRKGRARRGLDMAPEWYEIPAFYYSGTSNIYPSGSAVKYPSYSQELDYEMEVGIVIGREGRDIQKGEAMDYVLGMVLMNDWSARDVQRKEMAIGLGPAKSKDFATSIGPYIVTMDEIVPRQAESAKFDITVKAYVNSTKYSEGNLKDMYWSFADMIAWASRDTTLRPGDILMSGTVATGCILELGPEKYGWIRRGDHVRIESDLLGTLENVVR